jgi:steroid delta-isomerase-like uncharacterized protein
MSTPEENKALFRKYIDEVWVQRKTDAMAGYYATGFVDHVSMPGQPGGVEGVMARHAMLFGAFPDAQLTIEDSIAEGDTVATRLTLRGTNTGAFMGREPTSKAVEIESIDTSRFKDGKIVEHWEQMDLAGMLRQMGLAPQLAAPEQKQAGDFFAVGEGEGEIL